MKRHMVEKKMIEKVIVESLVEYVIKSAIDTSSANIIWKHAIDKSIGDETDHMNPRINENDEKGQCILTGCDCRG